VTGQEKKDNKGFGEGIELVKDATPEEKDVEINFGKILSFFGKGKSGNGKETAQHQENKPHHDTEKDAEIDLGKLATGIKGMFRSREKGGNVGQADDELSINPKKAMDFISRRGATILLVLGILVSIYLTAQVRTLPAQLPFADEWARNSVHNTIQNDISTAISQQYPNLPEARKNQILADEVAKAKQGKTYTFLIGQYAGQPINIQDQIKGTAELIKNFYRDNNGVPYSPDIDPYYWHRYAENVVEKGRVGDEVKNGLQWDSYQLAPFGRAIAPQDVSFPYFLAYMYKLSKVFSPSATLWSVQTTIYPMLLTGLTVLLIFLLVRKIAGNVGGFFASLMTGLHSAFVNRTIHGDNDAFVMFFAILTLWLFVEAIYARKALWRLTIAAGAGLAAALFSMAWGGWWFIMIFALSAAAATIAIGAAKTLIERAMAKEKLPGIRELAKAAWIQAFLLPSLVFVASTGVFVSLLSSPDRFLTAPFLAFGVTKLKTAVLAESYWPNVLTTVAELNSGSLQQAISSIRPGIFWLSALSAAILAAFAAVNIALPHYRPAQWLAKAAKPDERKALYAIFFAVLILVWFTGAIYATTKGIRFVLLLAPAAGIGFGITLGLVFRMGSWINEHFLKLNRIAVGVAIFAILAIATFSTDITKNAQAVAKSDVPIINDAWYDSLTAIRDDSDNTTKTAIITSWWDFGHHFKAIADRRVTFDGTTQQGPQAHWVGKFFMTKDETEAAGILRMLDCGSNTAFDSLNSARNDFAASIKALYRVTATPSAEEAERILMREEGLTREQAMNVTRYTHCTPPDGYVVASEDMIGKSGVWGHFGSWDFEKAIIWITLRGKSQKEAVEKMKEMFNYTDEKAKAVYDELIRVKSDNDANSWIAPWPSYSGEMSGCTPADAEGIVRCGNGLVANMTTKDAYFPTQDGKSLHPATFVYLTNETGTEEVVERAYANDTVPQRVSIILVPQGNAYYAVAATPEQAAGMFTRMFFFEGKGLRHFRMLSHKTGLTGTNVYVYKADWDSLK